MVIEVAVYGMHCDNCVAKVRAALTAVADVRHADVQFVGDRAQQLGRARVLGDAPRERIEKAIRDAGFDVRAA